MAVAWVSSTAHPRAPPPPPATVTLPTTAANDILILTVNNGGANAADDSSPTGPFCSSMVSIGSGGRRGLHDHDWVRFGVGIASAAETSSAPAPTIARTTLAYGARDGALLRQRHPDHLRRRAPGVRRSGRRAAAIITSVRTSSIDRRDDHRRRPHLSDRNGPSSWTSTRPRRGADGVPAFVSATAQRSR